MKSIAFLLLFVLVTSFASTAQSNTIEEAKQRANQLTELLDQKLKLSSDQLAKVTELNLGVAIKNSNVIHSTDQSYDFKVAAINGNNQGRRDYLKLFLTAEQFAKYESLEAEFIAADLIEGIEDIK
jgi:hypothetical protein